MGIKLEHRIGVQAPAEVIWESLADPATWPEWNPIYPRAAGVIRIGAQLDLTLQLPGQKPQEIKPVILDWTPFDHIHWTTKGRFLKAIRYIEIEVLSETGCIFSNGEIYDGWSAEGHVKRHGRTIRQGFTAMGEALRERAEAAWRARQTVTT